jgi:uncharacterized phiE125 gp8 family phage protein
MAGLKIATDTNIFPLQITEVKQNLRIDTDNFDQDAELNMMIRTAVETIEEYLGRSLITKTYDMYLDRIPYMQDDRLIEGFTVGPDLQQTQNYIILPKSPIVQVQHFKYYNDSDTESTFAASNYYVDNVGEPARLVLRKSSTFPSGDLRVANAFKIRFDAGYGTAPKDVPETIKQGISLYVSHLYENRELYIEQKQIPVPMMLESFLRPYRVLRFGSKLG